ncbi:MAG: proteasome subunit alpha [Propionibacteriaceae bacterium]|jgi:proteasome alpha subunit|nr:proteasome subunit alpha [Propionibacteriaceae bacterium]
MSQPTFYVSPEQQVKDRADFARAGIAKGRSVIVARYADGIVFVSENRSKSLHKVSEIYDRIGFAAVGRYNEFENLRVAGIRHADVRGYAYDRRDVTGRMLAGAYAQLLGTIFSAVMEKPWEVEIAVAEVGETSEGDEIYRLAFDGSITDEPQFAVMGGATDKISAAFSSQYVPGASLADVLRAAIAALIADPRGGASLTPDALEVGVLDRTRPSLRKFRRLSVDEITALTQAKPKQGRARKTATPEAPKTSAISEVDTEPAKPIVDSEVKAPAPRRRRTSKAAATSEDAAPDNGDTKVTETGETGE